jgi:hypothetical protein
MSTKRRIAAVVAVFLTAQVFAILIHGFILARDYAPFYGRLLRPMSDNPGWPIFMLPASHLAMSVAFVALLERTLREGPVLPQAIRFGVLAYLLGPVPMYLLWFAEQPWPSSLLVKQLPLELITFLTLGAVAGSIVKRPLTSQEVP